MNQLSWLSTGININSNKPQILSFKEKHSQMLNHFSTALLLIKKEWESAKHPKVSQMRRISKFQKPMTGDKNTQIASNQL